VARLTAVKHQATTILALAGIKARFALIGGVVAEGLDHHHDMTICWRRATVSFTTHDAGNQLTAKGLAAAAAVDGLGYPK